MQERLALEQHHRDEVQRAVDREHPLEHGHEAVERDVRAGAYPWVHRRAGPEARPVRLDVARGVEDGAQFGAVLRGCCLW